MVKQNKSRKHQSNMGNCAPRDFKMVQAMEKVTACGEQFQRGLAKCMQENDKAHRREVYWILFHAQWTDNHEVLRFIFAPRDSKPPKMLNTICYRVDNVAGRIDEEWVLPADAPAAVMPNVGAKDSEVSEQIANDAMGMPLANSEVRKCREESKNFTMRNRMREH